jgi:hypothetical protein
MSGQAVCCLARVSQRAARPTQSILPADNRAQDPFQADWRKLPGEVDA